MNAEKKVVDYAHMPLSAFVRVVRSQKGSDCLVMHEREEPRMTASNVISSRIILAIVAIAAIVLFFVVRQKKNDQTKQSKQTLPPPPSILVLDMDETMIHTPPPNHDRVILRPFVHDFLKDMYTHFDELVVFTAGTRDYASPILDRLEEETAGRKGALFSRRFYRDSCSIDPKTGLFAKDLRILGQPLDRVWILDNTPSAYALQPDRGVPIASFEGDPNDRALLKAGPLLADLSATGRKTSTSHRTEKVVLM